MDLDISPGDIDGTHRIGVSTKGKNRPIIVKFSRYMYRSFTESLTKIRMSALKEARNKFGFSSVWTTDRKILYKEGDTKTKVYFD